jgi:hypothetical protein
VWSVFLIVSLLLALSGCGSDSSNTDLTAVGGGGSSTTAATAPTPTPSGGAMALTVQFAPSAGARKIAQAGAGLSAAASLLIVHVLDPATGQDLPGSPLQVRHTAGDTAPLTVDFSGPAGTYFVLVQALDASGATLDFGRQSVAIVSGQTTSASIDTPLTLQTIAVTPPSVSLAVGTAQAFHATAAFSDASTLDVSSLATWTSSDRSVAIDGSGNATAVASGTATITAAYAGVQGSASATVKSGSVTATGLSVSPSAPTVSIQGTQQMTATATFSDGTTQDVTTVATWSSSAPTVASVSATGLVNGLSAGTSDIGAAFQQVHGSTPVTVTAATLQSIAVTPATPTINQGQTQQFVAIGTYSDASTRDLSTQATWASSNTGVATISSTGLATSAGPGGTTDITAALDSVTSPPATLTVNVVPGAVWQVLSTSDYPVSATVGNGTIVAVGGSGVFNSLVSTDGATWTPYQTAVQSGGTGVAFGNNLFVAVTGDGFILTSSDGRSWTKNAFSAGAGLYGVCYDGVRFVAVGASGTVATSTDGTTWTLQDSGFVNDLTAVSGHGGTAVAATFGGVIASTDGVNWTFHSDGVSRPLNGIGYYPNGSEFVAVGDVGTVVTSPDGVNWTSQTPGTTASFYAVTTSGTTLVVAGASGFYATSPDGTTFTASQTAANPDPNNFLIQALAALNGKVVALGRDIVANARIDTTSDLSTWTNIYYRYFTMGTGSHGIATNGTVITASGFRQIFTSPDGVTWTAPMTATGSAQVNAIAFANGTFLASEANGNVLLSADGTTWTEHATTTAQSQNGVAFGAGLWVAVGGSGTHQSSADGQTWSAHAPIGGDLYGVAYDGTRFIAVGDMGVILTSPDGIAWTGQSSGTTQQLFGVAALNGTIVVVGDGIILHSTDGVTWTAATGFDPSIRFVDAAAGDGSFVAVGSQGQIWRSADGATWSAAISNCGQFMTSATYDSTNQRFLSLGTAATVVVSP